MDAGQKLTIARILIDKIKAKLYFRLHERIKINVAVKKAYETPDLQINLDTDRHLVYLYVLDLNDNRELSERQRNLNYYLKNTEVLFGVITNGNTFLLYKNDAYDKLSLLGEHTLEEMCHYLNSFWIDLGLFPPLEVNDYSYTKSGGQPDIIIDKLDASYLIVSKTAVASGVAHPIPLTYDMLTLLLGFQPNSNGDLELNGFVVNNISGKFFHKGKRLTYLSQLQQCYRREMGELAIDETLLPNYII